MSRCFIPSRGPSEWQAFLAEPEKQWKTGYSAKTLAYSWETGDELPTEVSAIIKTVPRYANVETDLLMAVPEWKVPLPGGSTQSQNDVFALIGVGSDLLVAAIEGKVAEPFGETIDDWYARPSEGKKKRLGFLCDLLGLAFPPERHLRYQLFHRAASAIIECKRFRADAAAMIVHSFSPEKAWFEDYVAFAEALGVSPEPDRMVEIELPDCPNLLMGWASGDEAFLKA
jgi:hypothetical protein